MSRSRETSKTRVLLASTWVSLIPRSTRKSRDHSPIQFRLYALPREHAGVLSGDASPNVIASHGQYIRILAAVEAFTGRSP
jgi:hypothetical protein